MRLRGLLRLLPLALLLTPGVAHAQTAQQPSSEMQQRARIEQQLEELLRLRQELQQNQEKLQQQLEDFDTRIDTLQTELGAVPSQPQPAEAAPPITPSVAAPATPAQPAPTEPPVTRTVAAPGAAGEGPPEGATAEQTLPEDPFDPAAGIVLARGRYGETSIGIVGYVRYLNQGGLDKTYTDSFGRVFNLDLRSDVQLNRIQINFRGWLFDPRFRWRFYAWSQNVSQGEGAQVVVGGSFSYIFAPWLTFTAGIFSIPSTRSTAQSFPNWLMIDHRTMADEFFRGSYSQGYQATGRIGTTLAYNIALMNNLSQLGVSATELDFGVNSFSAALFWMPTTGEFGPAFGFGDYEYHDELATLLAVHYTRSREDSESQPNVNGVENSQIRLSDGTRIFGPDPFGTGGEIGKAMYRMLDIDAGVKYRGWSLEGEYYFRWVNDFQLNSGTIPVDSLFDHGFQLQASTMLIPRRLQAYLETSYVFGQYGDPWEVGGGLTFYPFNRKQVRVNVEGIYMHNSAIGYTAVPYQVGGKGFVFTVNLGSWF
jgi:hypothetical protein